MHIRLADLESRAPSVVVARYVGPVSGTRYRAAEHWLEVERVLKGKPRAVRIKVKRAPDGAPDLQPGTRCVAFLAAGDRFNWVATAQKGKTLETGALKLRGFYDFNAYLVTPALVTLERLVRYLKTKKLGHKFRGHLHFARRGRPGIVRSNHALSIERTADGAHIVTGMPRINGIRRDPIIHVTSGFGAAVRVVYSDRGKRLEIHGAITGIDAKTDELLARFWVNEPRLVDRATFRRFVRGRYTRPYWIFHAKTKRGTWKLELERESGRIGKARSPRGRTHPISSMGLSPRREIRIKSAGVVIEVMPAKPKVSYLGGGHTEIFVEELTHAPLRCRVRTGKSAQPCTLSLAATRFVRMR